MDRMQISGHTFWLEESLTRGKRKVRDCTSKSSGISSRCGWLEARVFYGTLLEIDCHNFFYAAAIPTGDWMIDARISSVLDSP